MCAQTRRERALSHKHTYNLATRQRELFSVIQQDEDVMERNRTGLVPLASDSKTLGCLGVVKGVAY